MNAAIATRLEFSTDTIEQIFSAALPPLAAGVERRFAVVQRPVDQAGKDIDLLGAEQTEVELLSVSPDNQLLHLRPSAHSQTGWEASLITLPAMRGDRRTLQGDVVKIDAYYQNGEIIALLHYEEGEHHIILPMSFTPERGWQELDIRGNVANCLYRTTQTEVYRTAQGQHFFYGVSTAFETPQFFIVFQNPNGRLEAVYERRPDTDATYRLLASGDSGHACLRIEGEDLVLKDFEFGYDDEEDEYYFEWGKDVARCNAGFGELVADNVLPFPSIIGSQNLLLLTDDNALHFVAGYGQNKLTSYALTGVNDTQPASVAQVCLGRDDQNRAVVFALSAVDSRLWVLRQQGFTEQGDIDFGDWVCLGNRANAIACPRAMLDGAELFLVNSENRALEHMCQDRETTLWSNLEVNCTSAAEAEHAKSEVMPCHAVEVESRDDNSQLVTLAALEIRSSYACHVSANDIGMKLNARQWKPLSTDASGKLNLVIPAESIHAPTLFFRVKATGKEFQVNPNARVSERLAGKDARVKIETRSLRAAGLIPENMPGPQANAVADMVRQLGKAEGASPENNSSGAALRMKIDQQGNHSKTVNVSPPDASAVTVQSLADKPEERPQGIPILGDVINLIKHAWEEFKNAVITVGKQFAELVVTVGNKVVKFVVDTAQGIAKTAEALFHTIAGFFKKVGEATANLALKLVKFVTALLGWQDVLITNEVIKLNVHQALESAQQTFERDLVDWGRKKADHLKSAIDDAFNQVEAVLGAMDPMQTQQFAAADGTGQTSAMVSALQNNKVAGRMVSNKLQRKGEAIHRSFEPGSDPQDAIFLEFAQNIETRFKHRMNDEVLAIFADFKPDSPAAFFSGGVLRTFRTMKPLLLFAIDVGEELMALALKCVGRMFQLIGALLNTEVYLNGVSEFVLMTRGTSTTLLDLVSLAIAIPMNLVHKLLHKLTAPFTQRQLEDMRAQKANWKNLFSFIGRACTAEKEQNIKISQDLKDAAQSYIDVMKVPSLILGLFTAVSDFAYGHVMALKHAVDSKEITGKAGTVFKIIAYLFKIIRFAISIPSKLITLAGILIAVTGVLLPKSDSPKKPSKLPYAMSICAGIATVIGLGLTIFALIAPMPALVVTVFVDVAEAAFTGLVAVMTIAALIYNGVITKDGWMTSADALDQLGSFFATIPCFFSFIPPCVPLLDSAYGAGEILLVVLLGVDIISGYGSGITGLAGGIIKLATQS
ncbi:chromate transporter [Planctobacterium marinum]|uniref:hypothetical protein n=1 Tax=Planctobacterium marinum TaxID=1631968 RepID=UPI001E345B6B|nr:hypothetical protein [Planctobacterium marinum]MCC2607761.1 hypothetical protein [Planctobacterium marinum]